MSESPIDRAYPEKRAGGFTSIDGSVEFYGRVNAVLRPEFRVLDFGAGRGAWFDEEDCRFRRELRLLKGKCREVVAADVDPVVSGNRSVDRTVHVKAGAPLPFADGAFDMIVTDFVLEHVDDPVLTSLEFDRILAPGGWICARTPNRWGYVSMLTRLIRNKSHARVLREAQPGRKELDVFPTRFRLNSMAAIREHFPAAKFENFSYYYQAEPAYHFNSAPILSMMRVADWIIPRFMLSNIFVFLRKRG